MHWWSSLAYNFSAELQFIVPRACRTFSTVFSECDGWWLLFSLSSLLNSLCLCSCCFLGSSFTFPAWSTPASYSRPAPLLPPALQNILCHSEEEFLLFPFFFWSILIVIMTNINRILRCYSLISVLMDDLIQSAQKPLTGTFIICWFCLRNLTQCNDL